MLSYQDFLSQPEKLPSGKSAPNVQWIKTFIGLSSRKTLLGPRPKPHLNFVCKSPICTYNIGPDGPELICHFANKCLYQKWSVVIFVCVCVCVCVCLSASVCVCVCVTGLKEELKFVIFPAKI